MLYDDLKNMLVNGQPQSHDEKLVTDLYGLLMDWEGRDAAGVAPLPDRMDAVAAVLGTDESLRPFAIVAIGYPAEEKKQQDRYDESRIHRI